MSGIDLRPKPKHKSLNVELWLRLFTFPLKLMPPSGLFLLRSLTKSCRYGCLQMQTSLSLSCKGRLEWKGSLLSRLSCPQRAAEGHGFSYQCTGVTIFQLALVLFPCGKMFDLGKSPIPPCTSFELNMTLLASWLIH